MLITKDATPLSLRPYAYLRMRRNGEEADACRMQQLNYSYFSKDNLQSSASKSRSHRDCIVLCNLIQFSYLIYSNVVFIKHNAHASMQKHTHTMGGLMIVM